MMMGVTPMELGSSTWFCLEMGYPWLSRILPNGIFHGENEENPWIFLGSLFSDNSIWVCLKIRYTPSYGNF
jgi:hypothetical protein